MPTGLVRVVRSTSLHRGRRTGGCVLQREPLRAARREAHRAPERRAAGPSGLEQRVTVKVDAAPAGSPYTAHAHGHIDDRNTGLGVACTSPPRMCLFQDSRRRNDRAARSIRANHLLRGGSARQRDLAPGGRRRRWRCSSASDPVPERTRSSCVTPLAGVPRRKRRSGFRSAASGA